MPSAVLGEAALKILAPAEVVSRLAAATAWVADRSCEANQVNDALLGVVGGVAALLAWHGYTFGGKSSSISS